jgi:hypothetical protein
MKKTKLSPTEEIELVLHNSVQRMNDAPVVWNNSPMQHAWEEHYRKSVIKYVVTSAVYLLTVAHRGD